MATIGYHCAHERFKPSELLGFIRLAEEVGFEAGMCSDHFHPWNNAQGQSGYTWSWLGAAMQATTLPFGMVTAPGQRYHPAIIAQAVATLKERYPLVRLGAVILFEPYDWVSTANAWSRGTSVNF